MIDLLLVVENIFFYMGIVSLDGGEFNFNYIGRYIIGRRVGK